jgi:hypothetical protein
MSTKPPTSNDAVRRGKPGIVYADRRFAKGGGSPIVVSVQLNFVAIANGWAE